MKGIYLFAAEIAEFGVQIIKIFDNIRQQSPSPHEERKKNPTTKKKNQDIRRHQKFKTAVTCFSMENFF